jgi:hypothetical protein
MKKYQPIITLLLLVTLITSAQTASWQWAYSAPGYIQATGTNIKTDAAGNVYALGYFYSAVLVIGGDTILSTDTAGYVENFYLIKYSPSGTVLWSTGLGDVTNGLSNPVMTTDAFGNVIVGGSFNGPYIVLGTDTLYNQNYPGRNIPFFLVKYNSSGNVVWTALGDTSITLAAISTDAAGNIYATGQLVDTTGTWGTQTLTNAGYTNAIIGKFDSSGNALWAHSFGGTRYDKGLAISNDAAGNSYISGIYSSPGITIGPVTLTDTNQYNYLFILKYDSSGNLIWGQGIASSSQPLNNNIVADAEGNVYVTGVIGGDDTIHIGGITLINPGQAGYGDVFTAKFNSTGQAIWAKCPQTNNEAYGTAITIGSNGNLYLAGNFSDTTIVFGTDTLRNPDITQNQPEALFIAALDTQGNAIWLADAGSSSQENVYGNALTTDADGNVYVTGQFSSSIVVFGDDTLQGTTVDESATLFIAKYGPGVTGINNIPASANTLLIYPNPSSAQFNFKGIAEGSILQIYNVLGQNIYTAIVSGDTYSLNLSGNAKGVYLYRVLNNAAVVHQGKIVLE